MNACVLKPILPFVTENELERTPATEENRKMAEFLDSHSFSFHINPETNDLKCSVSKRENTLFNTGIWKKISIAEI